MIDIFTIGVFRFLFLPYIIGIKISAIIICLIRKKLIGKDKIFRNSIYAIIIVFCVLLSRNLGYSVMNYLSAKPDKVYSEIKKINDSKRLIGLSKDEVINLLGEPLSKHNDNPYIYNAGIVTNYLFLGENDFYEFFIYFNENDRVESTSIQPRRGG